MSGLNNENKENKVTEMVNKFTLESKIFSKWYFRFSSWFLCTSSAGDLMPFKAFYQFLVLQRYGPWLRYCGSDINLFQRVPLLLSVIALQFAKSSILWNPVIYVLLNKSVCLDINLNWSNGNGFSFIRLSSHSWLTH